MLIKICGNTKPDNLREIEFLSPDLVGMIFYPPSKRYVGDELKSYSFNIPPVGVFVNESINSLAIKARNHGIKKIQLHGDESPSYCSEVKQLGFEIYKAFGISSATDFSSLASYEDNCDLFLFDTKSTQYGGTGKSFDWQLLNEYEGKTPFLLSGGIGLKNIEEALNLTHSQLAGFDLNSQLEDEPGIKNITQTKKIIQIIRNHERN